MARTDRLYQIERMIRHRGHVSFADLQQALEISRATLKRDLEYLRDQLGAPIEYDRHMNGYRFGGEGSMRGDKHELPGLWFSERELYALLMAHQLLSEIDADGMLSRHLQPLLERIHDLLGPDGERGVQALMKRVRIVGAFRRPVEPECFERVGEALVGRQRLDMVYLTRGRNATSQRQVSPQRLVHYKNTWYLDAWCHSRERLLRFALDAMQSASVSQTKAKDVPMRQVQAEMDAGYGIFAGSDAKLAALRFSPQAAPWISREQWHPEQQGQLLSDGSWELRLPYVDETELVMDILRQGEQVQVLGPASLRQAVRKRLQAALAQYN